MLLVRSMLALASSELHNWLKAQHAQMSKHNPIAKAINYLFEKEGRWEAFTRFLNDSRLCLTSNAAERALRRPQDERHRSAGLAGGRARLHAWHPRIKAAGTVAVELVFRRPRTAESSPMGRPTHVYTIDYVASLIGENIGLIQQVASNSEQHRLRRDDPRP